MAARKKLNQPCPMTLTEFYMSFRNRVLVPIALFFFGLRPRLFRVQRTLPDSRVLWVDVTRSSQSHRTTGIERVTREISSGLTKSPVGPKSPRVRFFRVSASGMPLSVADHWWGPIATRNKSNERSRCRFRRGDKVLLLDLSLAPQGLNLREVAYLRSKNIKVVATIYDTLPLTFPHLFPPQKSTIFAEWVKTVEQSDGFIYISETTRGAFRKATNLPSKPRGQKEMVLRLGSLTTQKTVAEIRGAKKMAETHPLNVLAVGTIEPRKDYGGIVDALDILWSEGWEGQFTLIGRPGWQFEETVERIQQHERYGRDLIWKKSVEDEELAENYASADCLVANSIAEGFGLPLIEAADSGVPVLARNIDVFKEALPTAEFFKGGDPLSLARKLKDLSERGRQQKIKGRRPASQNYPWRESATSVMNFVQDI